MKKSIKIIAVVLAILSVILMFTSCTSNKNAEKVLNCLEANECSTALKILKSMDKEEIDRNKEKINEQMALILDKEIKIINDDLTDTSLYLINPQIIDRFIVYNDILNYIDLDDTVTNTKSFSKNISILNQYLKYNDVAIAILNSDKASDSMNQNLESAQKMAVYWDPKDNTYFINAISDCGKARDCFAAKSDEYLTLGYNYYNEYYKILSKIKDIGEQQDTSNKYEKAFLEMTNELSDISNLVSDVVNKLPAKIY